MSSFSPKPALILALAAGLALGSCGGDDDENAEKSTATPTSTVAEPPRITVAGPGAISLEQAQKVKIGTPREQVLEEFGPPVERRRQKGYHGPCLIYERVGGRTEVERIQVCFDRNDDLITIASDVHL